MKESVDLEHQSNAALLALITLLVMRQGGRVVIKAGSQPPKGFAGTLTCELDSEAQTMTVTHTPFGENSATTKAS